MINNSDVHQKLTTTLGPLCHHFALIPKFHPFLFPVFQSLQTILPGNFTFACDNLEGVFIAAVVWFSITEVMQLREDDMFVAIKGRNCCLQILCIILSFKSAKVRERICKKTVAFQGMCFSENTAKNTHIRWVLSHSA